MNLQRIASGLAAVLLVAACGGGEDTTTTTWRLVPPTTSTTVPTVDVAAIFCRGWTNASFNLQWRQAGIPATEDAYDTLYDMCVLNDWGNTDDEDFAFHWDFELPTPGGGGPTTPK